MITFKGSNTPIARFAVTSNTSDIQESSMLGSITVCVIVTPTYMYYCSYSYVLVLNSQPFSTVDPYSRYRHSVDLSH